jgi:hypothetical protein
MSATCLNQARGDLVRVGLVAWQRPLYQVLALESPPGSAARELDADEIGIRIDRLHAALGRTP